MEMISAIKNRRSIRKFSPQGVSKEVIKEIVEVSRFAPSWKNTQIVRYIFVDKKEKIKALASAECTYGFKYNIATIENAPGVMLIVFKEGRSGFEKDGSFSTPKGDRWQMFDAGIAAQTFCLAAYEKGLGTVIMGYFDDAEIKKVISIPEGFQVGAVIPVGYPDGDAVAPPRKEVEELLSFE